MVEEYRPDGRKYEGEWRDNRQNGRGLYFTSKGIAEEGIWENGKKLDSGKKTKKSPTRSKSQKK